MNNETILTIVVPVYRIAEAYLRKCLDSILCQTDPQWRAILVDDGSPDGSGAILDEYAAKDQRFIAVHQENQGVSVARNQGIDAADTPYVTFIDPDDWVEATLVEEVCAALREHAPQLLAFGYTREFTARAYEEKLKDGSGFVDEKLMHSIRVAPLYRLLIDGRVHQYTVNAIWNKVYSVSFLNDHGIRFEPTARKGQDRVLNLYALDKAENLYYLDRCLYHYRNDNETSIVNRYNTSTNRNTRAVLDLVTSWLDKNGKGQEERRLFSAWVCTRLQESMRLYYFHEKHREPYAQVRREILEQISQEPYRSSLAHIPAQVMTREERIFVRCAQLHLFRICRLLIRSREWLRARKNHSGGNA